MRYFPGNKDVVEPPQECRCHKCKHPLKSGIAYFVIDEEGQELPVGPKCFKDWTGRATSSALTLALGFVEDGDNSQRGALAPQFDKASPSESDRRQKTAKENVMLRSKKLPEKGFLKTDREMFMEFLPRINNLTTEDVSEIERRVSDLVRKDRTKELKNMKWCNTVYGQMQRLLNWKEGFKSTKERVAQMRDHLRIYNGLLDKEMIKLREWSVAAEKYGIANSINGIYFAVNQARFDQYIQRKYQ